MHDTLMTAPARPVSPIARTGGRRLVLQGLLVLVLSLLLGGATSCAQTVLPDALRPFANSASGWTVLTASILWAVRIPPVPSAILGAVSFVTLVVGYQIVSDLRGFPTTEEFFLAVAVLAGPVVGVAASWLHVPGPRAAIGGGVLAAIAISESVWSLIFVAAYTGVTYWIIAGISGLALLAWTVARRTSTPRDRLVTVGTAAVAAPAFFAVYFLL